VVKLALSRAPQARCHDCARSFAGCSLPRCRISGAYLTTDRTRNHRMHFAFTAHPPSHHRHPSPHLPSVHSPLLRTRSLCPTPLRVGELQNTPGSSQSRRVSLAWSRQRARSLPLPLVNRRPPAPDLRPAQADLALVDCDGLAGGDDDGRAELDSVCERWLSGRGSRHGGVDGGSSSWLEIDSAVGDGLPVAHTRSAGEALRVLRGTGSKN
jgi:hypothetical protein